MNARATSARQATYKSAALQVIRSSSRRDLHERADARGLPVLCTMNEPGCDTRRVPTREMISPTDRIFSEAELITRFGYVDDSDLYEALAEEW